MSRSSEPQLPLEKSADPAADGRLATYGSLAPGAQNHHIVAHLGGSWTQGYVAGELVDRGWGAAIGHPALRWSRLSPRRIPVHLLTSDALPGFWKTLDDFEGQDYRRIIVPVYRVSQPSCLANIYVLAE